MKGIILAGGSGTRLYPITKALSKQLVPIYDKPMIYYPLSTLISTGIRDILFITTEVDRPQFERLLGDGSLLGCSFSYATQNQPRGLAEALIIGESFIGKDDVCFILGDNLFSGRQIAQIFQQSNIDGAVIFAYQVANPEQYGIVFFNKEGIPTAIEEKPSNPTSNYAVPGIYFYDNTVVEVAKTVRPSARGELEITSIHNHYLAKQKIKVIKMHRNTVWLDTGTIDSLSDATDYVRVIEKRHAQKVGCIEEEAFRQGAIDSEQLLRIAEGYKHNSYGQYLKKIVQEKNERDR